MHGFAEVSKNLTRYGYENNFVGSRQNNYVERVDNKLHYVIIILMIQQNYF